MQELNNIPAIPTQIEINHLSDTHTHKGDEKNARLIERMKLITRNVIKEQQCPINIFTGDITDDADPEQMNNFLNILGNNRLVGSALILPGNHDCVRFGNQVGIVTNYHINAIINFQQKQLFLINTLLRSLRTCGLRATSIVESTDPFTKQGWFFNMRKTIGPHKHTFNTVSYTHLTLPTKRIV